MKQLRILIVIIFIAIATAFVVYTERDRRTSDFTAPVIQADSDTIEASVNVTDEELLKGMTATDNLDGDVTASLVVGSRSKFIRKGTVRVSYAAFDKNNNVGSYVRDLTYTDYVPPRFAIHAPLAYIRSETRDVQQILKSITAHDCIDGDITPQIILTQGETRVVNSDVTAQTVNLQVSNRSGDTSTLELEVLFEDYNVFNQQRPHLSDYLIYVKVGEHPDFRSVADGIGYGNNFTSFADSNYDRNRDVAIDTSEVDTDTPGTYHVIYTLTREVGDGGRREDLGSTVLTVVVEE